MPEMRGVGSRKKSRSTVEPLPLVLILAGLLSVSSSASIAPELLQRIDTTTAAFRGSKKLLSPRAWRKETAVFGLPGLDLPEDVGGRGYTALQMTEVFEHMGKVSLDMRDMIGGAHVRPLLQSESPEIRRIIEDVARGTAYIAIAITEKEAGSEMRAMTSNADKVKGGYSLSGEKQYNARLETATHIILFTRSPYQTSATTRLNAFILPKNYPGLEFKKLTAHGLLGNSLGGLTFNRIFVPEKFRIGGEGEGGKLFRNHFLYWRLMQASAAIGTGRGALDQAVVRLRNRQAFGGPIGRFTHFQQELAQHTAQLHMAALLVKEAANLIDQERYPEAIPLVAMAKGEGVEWALQAADFAMELHGAEGYSPELSDLGQRVRDLQGLRIADGTTHIMRQEVVRHFYGDDFWDMAIGGMDPGAMNQGRLEDLPAGVFNLLRNELRQQPAALLRQDQYDSLVDTAGVGACPTVAVANLMQGLGVMGGGSQVVDLDLAIRAAYADNPRLRKGLLTNKQILGVIDFFQQKYFPNSRFKVHVDFHRAFQNGAQPEGARAWTDLDSALLTVRPHELKLVSYTETDPAGWVLGRHFVILKDQVEDSIAVVDPQRPTRDYIYKVKRQELPGKAGSSLQLVRPRTPKSGANTLNINTVFTVRLEGNP